MEFTADERVAAWRVLARHGWRSAATAPTAPTKALFHICDSSSEFQQCLVAKCPPFSFPSEVNFDEESKIFKLKA